MGAGVYDEAYDAEFDDCIDEDETAFDFDFAVNDDTNNDSGSEDTTAVDDTDATESMFNTDSLTETVSVPEYKLETTGVPGVTVEYKDGTVELADEPPVAKFDATAVKMQPETDNIAYPCVWLKAETMPGYVAQALQALLTGGAYDNDVNIYPVYAEIVDAGVSLQLGYIDSRALRNLLSKPLFAAFEKRIKLNADDKNDVSGDMMYAMCTCQSFA